MTVVTETSVAAGDAGIAQTLNVMAALIRGAASDPEVLDAARAIVTRSIGGGMSTATRARAVRSWLASVWRFVEDPIDRELLRSPRVMLDEYCSSGVVRGDCDEAATLGGALGFCAGFGVQLVVLAFAAPELLGPPPYSHVYAVLLTDDGTSVELDITRPSGPVPPIQRASYISV